MIWKLSNVSKMTLLVLCVANCYCIEYRYTEWCKYWNSINITRKRHFFNYFLRWLDMSCVPITISPHMMKTWNYHLNLMKISLRQYFLNVDIIKHCITASKIEFSVCKINNCINLIKKFKSCQLLNSKFNHW